MQDGSAPPASPPTSHIPGEPQNTGADEVLRPPKASLFSGFLSLLTALAVVLAVRSVVFEPFKIPSGSMMPTLLKGDHIFVKKFAYSIRVPFTDFFGPGIAFFQVDAPKRGDIIVFRYPRDESTHFIKRVVGLPGDTIQIQNKILSVNGKTMAKTPLLPDSANHIAESFDDSRYRSEGIEMFNEQLDAANHVIMIDKSNTLSDSFGPITVPADNLFVMGDNRDYSNDSRFWGFVPTRNVTGKAMFIWMSFFYDRSESKTGFHPERIGTVLK